jgi:hypothetical protein
MNIQHWGTERSVLMPEYLIIINWRKEWFKKEKISTRALLFYRHGHRHTQPRVPANWEPAAQDTAQAKRSQFWNLAYTYSMYNSTEGRKFLFLATIERNSPNQGLSNGITSSWFQNGDTVPLSLGNISDCVGLTCTQWAREWFTFISSDLFWNVTFCYCSDSGHLIVTM